MSGCMHVLETLRPEERPETTGRPYRYQCVKCGALLKIASGIVSAPTPDLAAAERGRRLMDAAPDLLAALEFFLEHGTEGHGPETELGCCGVGDAVVKAREAIRKAKGSA